MGVAGEAARGAAHFTGRWAVEAVGYLCKFSQSFSLVRAREFVIAVIQLLYIVAVVES